MHFGSVHFETEGEKNLTGDLQFKTNKTFQTLRPLAVSGGVIQSRGTIGPFAVTLWSSNAKARSHFNSGFISGCGDEARAQTGRKKQVLLMFLVALISLPRNNFMLQFLPAVVDN